MNSNETPTPRTDECLGGNEHGNAIEFLARELEHELSAANAKLADAHIELVAKDTEIFVPGQWRCEKCGFQLTKSLLCFRGGGIAPDLARAEPCPNDGEAMLRCTWKGEAMALSDRLCIELPKLREAEARVAALEKELAEAKNLANRCELGFKLAEQRETDVRQILDTYVGIEERAEKAESDNAALREQVRVLREALEKGVRAYDFPNENGGYAFYNEANAALALTPDKIASELAELREDKARLDWEEEHRGVDQLHFKPFHEGWHQEVKAKWPHGFWRWQFGPKYAPNRYVTRRAAIDAARKESK